MKITHTIIRNGISRGIPEGTKVPEKPRVCVIPCFAFGQQCTCDKLKNNYYNDLQSLWDSSVEWEDQRLVNENLFTSRDKISEAELAEFALTGKHRDGIYPLEGVNADIALQWFYQAREWVDCPQKFKDKNSELKFRNILRLIPQPDSEQSITDEDIMSAMRTANIEGHLSNRQPNDKVEGIEVSEPKRFTAEEYAGIIKQFRQMQKEEQEKILPSILNDGNDVQVGFDDKKEPETWSHQNFCKKCQLLTAHISANNVCIVCGTVNFRGVSEGEPNQEELWIEALKYLRHMLGSYSTTIHKAKGMAEYFHIQKLKP